MIEKQEVINIILKEIGDLPPLPENIKAIRDLINDPKSNSTNISNLIKRDPALTAGVLRVANSAAYMTRAQVDTVEQAVTLIGLRQLSTTLLTIGAQDVLNSRYKQVQEIWDHSYQCAFFAQQLMKMKNGDDEVESAYIAGLLHDIGKIILISITPDLVEKIRNLQIRGKFMDASDIEKLAIGLHHAEIGEMIAIKWAFPEKLGAAIGLHHSPILVKKEWRPLVYTVYLANQLTRVENMSEAFYQSIEPKVLDFFKLSSVKQLEMIHNTLKEFYSTISEINFL